MGSTQIEQFMPHGMCYLWNVRLLALHVISDAVIALAYFSIPIILLVFVRKRHDLPFPAVFAMFGLFIVACGMTHVLEIWTIWHPTYWLSGYVKAFTACVSLATAVLLVRTIPQALTMKGRSDLFQQLAELNATLEQQVLLRTAKLQAQEDELKRLATTDPLTGLGNRRALDDILEREWGRARRAAVPLAMIMVDLDYFKEFNDFYGHPKGDECLKVVAGLLRSHARRPVDFVSRYGGEEFIVLLPDTGVDGASHVAHRLYDALGAAQIKHQKSPLSKFVTASFGVAVLVPDRVSAAGTLVATADEALYEAKNTGRNRIAFKHASPSGTA